MALRNRKVQNRTDDLPIFTKMEPPRANASKEINLREGPLKTPGREPSNSVKRTSKEELVSTNRALTKHPVSTEKARSRHAVSTNKALGKHSFRRNPSQVEYRQLNDLPKILMAIFVREHSESDFTEDGDAMIFINTKTLRAESGKSASHISNRVGDLVRDGFIRIPFSNRGGMRQIAVNKSIFISTPVQR